MDSNTSRQFFLENLRILFDYHNKVLTGNFNGRDINSLTPLKRFYLRDEQIFSIIHQGKIIIDLLDKLSFNGFVNYYGELTDEETDNFVNCVGELAHNFNLFVFLSNNFISLDGEIQHIINKLKKREIYLEQFLLINELNELVSLYRKKELVYQQITPVKEFNKNESDLFEITTKKICTMYADNIDLMSWFSRLNPKDKLIAVRTIIELRNNFGLVIVFLKKCTGNNIMIYVPYQK